MYPHNPWQDDEEVDYNGTMVRKSGLLFVNGSPRPPAPPWQPPSAADDTILDPGVTVTWVAGTNTIQQSDPAFNLLGKLKVQKMVMLASLDAATGTYTEVARGKVEGAKVTKHHKREAFDDFAARTCTTAKRCWASRCRASGCPHVSRASTWSSRDLAAVVRAVAEQSHAVRRTPSEKWSLQADSSNAHGRHESEQDPLLALFRPVDTSI